MIPPHLNSFVWNISRALKLTLILGLIGVTLFSAVKNKSLQALNENLTNEALVKDKAIDEKNQEIRNIQSENTSLSFKAIESALSRPLNTFYENGRTLQYSCKLPTTTQSIIIDQIQNDSKSSILQLCQAERTVIGILLFEYESYADIELLYIYDILQPQVRDSHLVYRFDYPKEASQLEVLITQWKRKNRYDNVRFQVEYSIHQSLSQAYEYEFNTNENRGPDMISYCIAEVSDSNATQKNRQNRQCAQIEKVTKLLPSQ